MNAFDNLQIDQTGFSYRDLLAQDHWDTFTVSASITVVGDATYAGRVRFVGKQAFFQVAAIASTSIETTAGTSYITLPRQAVGIGGVATMTNNTTNIAVGTCHIDVATSRCYLPTQGPSGDSFTVNGWYEI